MSIDLHFGDARDVLAAMEPCSVHAVVTDNPYHIKFMGREWDAGGAGAIAYDPEFWALCLRVLKPGGHLCAFGAPRTHHRIWCAVEDAGFQIRDTLQWLRGKGFPKNHDVARHVDAALGAEWTEFIDNPAQRPGNAHDATTQTGWAKPDRPPKPVLVTDEAKRWADWGTALKPADEPILLARRPLEGTIAENVLAHGVGGLNVGACRVGTSKSVPASISRTPNKRAFEQGLGGHNLKGDTSGFDPNVGRWPPNVLLSHLPGCEPVGMREVQTGTAVYRNKGKSTKGRIAFGADGTKNEQMRDDVSYGEGGTEVVQRWACAPGCVVAELDRQSGPSGAKAPVAGTEPSAQHARVYDSPRARVASVSRDDLGAASRFFPNFDYASPATTRERDAGCDDFYWRRGPRNSWERVDRETWAQLDERDRARGNVHPTVKPLSMVRWLVRLVCPPDGVVLDPFIGSGTTALACLREGFSCVGVELDPDHFAIARARVRYATTEPVAEHGDDLPPAPAQRQGSLF